MTPNSSEPRIVEQFDFEMFWAKHGQKVMVGALVVLALGGGAFLWQRQQARNAAAAATRLATAQDPQMLEAVAQEYAGQETGAQALLRLASAHFRAGRYDDAARVYQQFQAQHPRHQFAPTAALGLAAVREAKGDYAGAKDLYLAMTGGQASMQLSDEDSQQQGGNKVELRRVSSNRPIGRVIAASADELIEHQTRLTMIDKASEQQCLWLKDS
jgi:predicted negative regulator of RcsB-dependent stress response